MAEAKIIVTGGAGFIGSAVVWRLNELGCDDILVVDRMDETDKWKNLAPLRFADYIDADDFLDDIGDLKHAEAIFHLGACSSTMRTNSRNTALPWITPQFWWNPSRHRRTSFTRP